MQIYVNGETRDVPEDVPMNALLDLLELSGRRIAVEVNDELVPRSRFAEYRLQSRDRVEIVHAIGGG